MWVGVLLVAVCLAEGVSAQEPLRVGGHIAEPRHIKRVAPEYPIEAQKAGIQDIVFLDCVIGTDGTVTSVKALRGDPVLAEAASKAVLQWVYTPTLLNGEPVAITMNVVVNYVARPEALDEMLIKALGDHNPFVREAAASLCRWAGVRTSAMERALNQATKDPDKRVRASAERAITEVRKRALVR